MGQAPSSQVPPPQGEGRKLGAGERNEELFIVRTSTGRREVKKRDSATIEYWEEKSVTKRRSDGGNGEVGVQRTSLGYRKEEIDGNTEESRIIEESKHEEKRWIKGDDSPLIEPRVSEEKAIPSSDLNLSSKKIKTLIPAPEALAKYLRSPTSDGNPLFLFSSIRPPKKKLILHIDRPSAFIRSSRPTLQKLNLSDNLLKSLEGLSRVQDLPELLELNASVNYLEVLGAGSPKPLKFVA